jgi:signal transduction histidine kinase
VSARLDSATWVLSLLAAGIAMVFAILIPAGYFLLSYQYMTGSLGTQAELAARVAETLVMANPDTWQFEEIRLQEFLQRHHDQAVPEMRTIVDNYGNVIARMADPLAKPLVVRRCDIFDAGAIVGRVEIARSLRPLLVQTGLIGLVSLLLGGLLFLVLRAIPLKAVRAEQRKTQELDLHQGQLQKAESLARMAGAIAHNFNNLIAVVIGHLELANLDLPQESATAVHLTKAMSASLRAAEASRLMLTYLGQTPGKHERMDLSEAMQMSLSSLRDILPKTVVLASKFPSSGPTTHANTEQMHQVLVNLVTNSLESIGDNQGTITLTIESVLPAEIPTMHRFPIDWQPQSQPYACLAVEDTGGGILALDIEKLFDPFFTTKFTGRGMGLPVVLGIVRAHDGGVVVDSRPGRGTIVRVYLPKTTE